MLLNVKVRELELPINVGAGTQTFKWLAMITTSQYARKHPQFREEQYIAIHVTDKGGSPLFPNDQIANRLVDGDDVIVELLGPKLGPSDPSYSRDKTLWELYAYATPQDFVNVTLLFDASEVNI